MTDHPGYMRVVDFCAWSDLSASTTHRLCRRGLLRKVRIGGASLIDLASWHELMREGYRGSVRDMGPSSQPEGDR